MLHGSKEDPAAKLAWREFRRELPQLARRLAWARVPLSEELARCLAPHVHERRLRPFGAVVCRDPTPLADTGRLIAADGLPPPTDLLGDGQTSFVVRGTDAPHQVLLLAERVRGEIDLVRLARQADGVIVTCDPSGRTRVICSDGIAVVEHRTWRFKEPLEPVVDAIHTSIPAARKEVVRALLAFGFHELSARNIGATLLLDLLADEEVTFEHRDRGKCLLAMGLSVLARGDSGFLIHLAAFHDGALLFDAGGRLHDVGAFLKASRSAQDRVPQLGGARHTSAARHTHDRPDCLAIVVSEDGPVTVFSDGHPVAELRIVSDEEELDRWRKAFPYKSGDVSIDSKRRNCPSCRVMLHHRTITVLGWKEQEEAICPECGGVVDRRMCFENSVTLIKSKATIEKLVRRRRGESSAPS